MRICRLSALQKKRLTESCLSDRHHIACDCASLVFQQLHRQSGQIFLRRACQPQPLRAEAALVAGAFNELLVFKKIDPAAEMRAGARDRPSGLPVRRGEEEKFPFGVNAAARQRGRDLHMTRLWFDREAGEFEQRVNQSQAGKGGGPAENARQHTAAVIWGGRTRHGFTLSADVNQAWSTPALSFFIQICCVAFPG